MKVAKIITGVIVVLVVALVVGLVFKFTNGFNEDFKTFYLEQDGKQILTSETERAFVQGEQYRYEVKYTFDSGKSEPKGYNVKVVPNGKIKLSFKADGKQYSYADAKELTSVFGIKKEASAFTISVPAELTLKGVLEKVYGKTVEVEEQKGYLYTLVVSSYNEKVTYKINFGLAINVEGIELDKDGIVFGGEGESSSDNPNTPSSEEYAIGYDTLGNGSVKSIQFDCKGKAVAGEMVSFTVSLVDLSDVYDDYIPVDITRIVVNSSDTGEEEIEIGSGEGTFSFKMPAHDVTVMFYLMSQ